MDKKKDKYKIIKVAISTIVILALMLLGGNKYMYSHGLSGKYANTEVKEGQIKVACVGDSITYGHGVENWEENNYPAQLQKMLGEAYHVANFGSSGACVNPNGDQPYTGRAVYQESLDYDADIIIVMLGTNDSKAENWVDMNTFIQEYFSLLHTYYREEDPPKVYIGVCAESYYTKDADRSTGVADFDIRPAIVDSIASVLSNGMPICDCDFSASVIDIHSLTEAHPEWFEADGIHPNADGAKGIAEMIAASIEK